MLFCSQNFHKINLKKFQTWGGGGLRRRWVRLITAFNLQHLYRESKYDLTQRINTQIIKSEVFNLMLHSGVQI